MPDPSASPDLDTARRRLEAALARLEGVARGGEAPASGPDAERDRLKAALDDSRARERQLEQVAAEAAAALGRAAAEVRAALAAEA